MYRNCLKATKLFKHRIEKVETKVKQTQNQRHENALVMALSHTVNPLYKVRGKAKSSPECIFHSLAHLLTVGLLIESFKRLNKDASTGSDGLSYATYAASLDFRIRMLHQKLKSGEYKPQSIKRVWIDKDGSKKRPIGISSIEDKIVQRAVTTILNVIYEQDFYDFSYGFREKRNAHQALHYFWQQSMRYEIRWFINADIKGCFDNFKHDIMLELLNKRVKDGRLNQLITSWMEVGIIDGKEMTVNESGTPQGGIISPLLANIYLHEVIDKWIIEEIKPRLKGEIFIVRYADDFIIGLQYQKDAEKLFEILPKRLSKYGLELSTEKSRLQNFIPKSKDKNNTIDFLGFTHYWTKSQKGKSVIKRKTRKKSKVRILKELYQEIKSNRHQKLKEQYIAIRRKLQGYYGYYAIRGNFPFLNLLRHKARKFWYKMLNHRGGRKKSYTIDSFKDLMHKFELPKPKILHRI